MRKHRLFKREFGMRIAGPFARASRTAGKAGPTSSSRPPRPESPARAPQSQPARRDCATTPQRAHASRLPKFASQNRSCSSCSLGPSRPNCSPHKIPQPAPVPPLIFSQEGPPREGPIWSVDGKATMARLCHPPTGRYKPRSSSRASVQAVSRPRFSGVWPPISRPRPFSPDARQTGTAWRKAASPRTRPLHAS